MKPLGEISEQIERMRTQDINIEANSSADRALHFQGHESRMSKRLSTRRLSGLFTSSDHAASTGGAAEGLDESFEEEVIVKSVEGREIKQDHELYALTYGMMLGIRVMVRQSKQDYDMLLCVCVCLCLYFFFNYFLK